MDYYQAKQTITVLKVIAAILVLIGFFIGHLINKQIQLTQNVLNEQKKTVLYQQEHSKQLEIMILHQSGTSIDILDLLEESKKQTSLLK
jgi:predicted PurR-regulated permease PerM